MENIKKTKFVQVSNYSIMDLTDVIAVSTDEIYNSIYFLFKNGVNYTVSYDDFSALEWLEKIKKELGM